MFLMLAASKTAGKRKVPIDASLDEVVEIDEGLRDLESAAALARQGRASPYWPKIRERLLQYSSSDNVDEAIREWADEGNPFVSHGTCELCDKNPIKFHFPIKNRVTGKSLVVGSECVLNYLLINGYESIEALRKRLVAQRNILKKQEKGEASLDQVSAVNEAFSTEKEIRDRIGVVAGAGQDFNVREYYQTLWEVISIGNALKITSSAFESAREAHRACRSLMKFMESTRKRQKGFQGFGLASLVSTVMRQREPTGRLTSLVTLRRHLNTLFQSGLPADVISRAWGAIRDSKEDLLEEVTKKCDLGKANLLARYKSELSLAKPYSHLNFILTQGLIAQRREFDAQVAKIERALQSEDFLDQLKNDREGSGVAKLLNLTFYPDLGNSDGSLEAAAYNIGRFLSLISGGYTGSVTKAVVEAFQADRIRDLPGIRVALLRAADDGIVDADILGERTLVEFEKLVRAKDPRVVDLLYAEVDDFKALAKAVGTYKVYEVMSDDFGFDVSKAYKLYSKDNDFEYNFCLDILARWKQNRGSFSLSPAQMENFKRQLVMKGRIGEVPNSMWDALRSELTAHFKG